MRALVTLLLLGAAAARPAPTPYARERDPVTGRRLLCVCRRKLLRIASEYSGGGSSPGSAYVRTPAPVTSVPYCHSPSCGWSPTTPTPTPTPTPATASLATASPATLSSYSASTASPVSDSSVVVLGGSRSGGSPVSGGGGSPAPTPAGGGGTSAPTPAGTSGSYSSSASPVIVGHKGATNTIQSWVWAVLSVSGLLLFVLPLARGLGAAMSR